jgi:hypothetical protein
MKPEDEIWHGAPDRLARLMAVVEDAEVGWKVEDLAAILAHQLQAHVGFELENLRYQSPAVYSRVEAAGVRSFQQLFEHSDPPLELLRMTKDFARAHSAHPESSLAKEIVTTLYFASVSLAMVRHQVRITQLNDPELRQGITWCLAQAWMQPGLQRIFRQALEVLPDSD